MEDRRRPLGLAGEQAAAAYLESKGYSILARNWRCKFGELDMVAKKEGVLVFVEVRSRSAKSLGFYGTPAESITPKKQAKLRRCAEAYIGQHRGLPVRARFDCIGIILGDRHEPMQIEHIENAF